MNTSFTFEALIEEYAPIVRELLTRMDGERYAHTLAVARESLLLSREFALSERDAKRLFVASLLHDVTKAYDLQGQLSLAEELGVHFTEEDVKSPPVLHSFTGAAMASRDFPTYTDSEIEEAIRCHTVGKADMSLFDKLLFIADYIEATRKHPICIETRAAFYKALAATDSKEDTLDRFVLLIAENTLEHLQRNGRTVHSHTLKTIESLTDPTQSEKG